MVAFKLVAVWYIRLITALVTAVSPTFLQNPV